MVDPLTYDVATVFSADAARFWSQRLGVPKDGAIFSGGALKMVRPRGPTSSDHSDNSLVVALADRLDGYFAQVAEERRTWRRAHLFLGTVGRFLWGIGEFPNQLEREIRAGKMSRAIKSASAVDVRFDTKMTLPGGEVQTIAEPVARQLAVLQAEDPKIAAAVIAGAIADYVNRLGSAPFIANSDMNY